MRNDALDEPDVVPRLTNDARDCGEQPEPRQSRPVRRNPVPAQPSGISTGALWALLVAVLIAFAGLAWWNYQQIALLNQQLVATQESFAQISEDAAGRIKAITGKVVATESSVTNESESLKLRVRQLEGKLAELGKQQQVLLGQQAGLGKRAEQFSADLQSQQASLLKADGKLQALAAAQETLAAAQEQLVVVQAELASLNAQQKAQSTEIATLKQQGNSIARIEQDLLVLRSELDKQAAKSGSTSEFDAFRAQVSRDLITLKGQIQNLQQQLNGRP